MKHKLFQSSRDILLAHVERLKKTSKLRTANDKRNAELFEEELSRLAKRHKTLARIRIIVFVVLYASVVATFVSQLPVLEVVAQTVAAVGGLLGVGLLSVIAFYLTFRIGQKWDRMILVYTHLIAIYEKNNTGLYHIDDLAREISEAEFARLESKKKPY